MVRCNYMPEVAPGIYELWDDAWVNTGEWDGDKPWPEVPLVVIATEDIKAVGIKVNAVADAVRRRMKDTHPGQLFTLPDDELKDLLDKFED